MCDAHIFFLSVLLYFMCVCVINTSLDALFCVHDPLTGHSSQLGKHLP